MRVHEVTLVGVVDGGVLLVVPPLQLHRSVVDGWLEVAVLSVDHHPHIGLHTEKARVRLGVDHHPHFGLYAENGSVWGHVSSITPHLRLYAVKALCQTLCQSSPTPLGYTQQKPCSISCQVVETRQVQRALPRALVRTT